MAGFPYDVNWGGRALMHMGGETAMLPRSAPPRSAFPAPSGTPPISPSRRTPRGPRRGPGAAPAPPFSPDPCGALDAEAAGTRADCWGRIKTAEVPGEGVE